MLLNPILLLAVNAYDSPFRAANKPFPQTVQDAENVLKYMGDRGPYVDRRGYGINRDPPAGCTVEQVVFLGRHGERFPNEEDYTETYEVLRKVLACQGNLNGSLSFANNWTPFLEEGSSLLGTETTVGLYSGLLDGYSMGVEARRRYYDLYDGQSHLKFYASNSSRVVSTAETFASGFLNWNFTQLGEIVVVPEKDGANTLKPSCKPKNKNVQLSTCKGGATSGWIYPEFHVAAARLNNENPELNLTAKDIPLLIYQIPSEIDQRGTSPWISAFTSEEFVAFNYWVTSHLYCTVGPGSYIGPLEGQIFLNATRKLLMDGPGISGPLTFAFTHHTSILPILATLGIDELSGQWDPTEVQFGQRYDITDLTPMGARAVFERLRCPRPMYDSVPTEDSKEGSWRDFTEKSEASAEQQPLSDHLNDVYLRFVLNEAVVPLAGCSNGPGKSCKLEKFDKLVDDRIGDRTFQSECKIKKHQPSSLTFFWDN